MKKYINISILVLFSSGIAFSQNLILNPDCELPLVFGEIPNWTEVFETDWKPRSDSPNPQNGQNYFYPCEGCNGDEAELAQVIDVSKYSCAIDLGVQKLQFIGYVRSYPQSPRDQSQIIIEQLAGNNQILATYDSGNYNTTNQWVEVSSNISVVPNTRKIRIRLLSHRKAGTHNDGYYDNLSLVPDPANENLEITNVVTQPTTCGLSNGSIMISTKGGAGQIQFSIDGGITFQQTSTFSNLTGGQYNVLVKDINGCTDEQNINMATGASLEISNVQVRDATCNLDNGKITVLAINGSGQVQYSINGLPFQDSQSFVNLKSNNYLITVKDAIGCIDTLTVYVESPAVPVIDSILSKPSICTEANGILTVLASGGVGALHYSINNSLFQIDPILQNLNFGNYKVTVRDSNGCTAEATIHLEATPKIEIEKIVTQYADCGEANGFVEVQASGGVGNLQYFFNNKPNLDNYILLNVQPGEIRLSIVDSIGCKIDSSFFVGQNECPFYIPNVISPNDDGLNDKFQVFSKKGSGATIIQYVIYDRWGGIIFEKRNFDVESSNSWWNGTFRGKEVETGVYLYLIEIQMENSRNSIVKSGNVSIIK